MKLTEAEVAYTIYVCEHVRNVKDVWKELSNNHCKDEWWLDDCIHFSTDSLIKQHDRSKLGDDEFRGYQQWFYPLGGAEKSERLFIRSWNHHQKKNKHHWQYWLMWKPEGTTALNMPFPYILEMLCDWSAMSLKFGDTPSEFYEKNKGEMLLHIKTQGAVLRWLPLFDKVVGILAETTTEGDTE